MYQAWDFDGNGWISLGFVFPSEMEELLETNPNAIFERAIACEEEEEF